MQKSPVYYYSFLLVKLIVLLSLICAHRINAQTRQIDSLLEVLPGASPTQRFDVLFNLAYEHVDLDNAKAIEFADQAIDDAMREGDSLHIVKSLRIKAAAARRMEKFNDALEVSQRALAISRRNGFVEESKYLLNTMAVIYTFLAEYDKSLDYHFQSLVLREREGNKAETSITLNNIGFVFYKLKNYEKAVEYYSKALAYKKESDDTYDLDRLLINLGLSYNNLRRFDEAIRYINQGLATCGREKCNPAIRIEAEFGLGGSFFGTGKFDEALSHYETSYRIAQEIDNERFQAENLVYIGRIAIEKDDLPKARTALKMAEAIAKKYGYNQLMLDTYKQLARLFNKEKNFEEAASYQSSYIRLNDSLMGENLIRNLAKIQTDYAERENQAIIASKEQVIKQQRDLNIAIAVIAILAGLLILVLQRSNRTFKQVNAKLSEAKETIQEQNLLLESRNKDLDKEVAAKTADLERVNLSLKQVNDELDNFIYKTSHDIRGPLASLKGMCNVALMDVKDPIALDYLRKLDTTAERLNTILTRLLIINQINNSKLSVSRIDFAHIVSEVLQLEKKKGLPNKLQIRSSVAEDAVIESDRELVRIVLENLIDNAIKFYNDSERVNSFVDIHIFPTDNVVKARVIDNGIGITESNPGKLFQMFFRASERSEIGGIGLYIVKTATAKLGGKVGLMTTPEGHTEFYVLFPMTPPPVGEEEIIDKHLLS